MKFDGTVNISEILAAIAIIGGLYGYHRSNQKEFSALKNQVDKLEGKIEVFFEWFKISRTGRRHDASD